MAKTRMCNVLILASVGLNLFLIVSHVYEWKKNQKLSWSQEADSHFYDRKSDQKLSWSLAAAAEAEAVAAINCSGHGRAYLDGLVVDGKPVCECNSCYVGSDCSQFLTGCAADADSGDPTFLETFWKHHKKSGALLISPWHRMAYTYPDGSYISAQLEHYIRKLHLIAKNANTQGKYIIFGVGSTQLQSAAVFALTNNLSSSARVVAAVPYYPVYKSQTEYFETARFKYQENYSSPINCSIAQQVVVEFVTSPNNPDGKLRKPVFEGPFCKQIYDRAYYWPHYTAIKDLADDDLMMFTLSKLTGDAGSRLGWALVKDKEIYENMVQYVGLADFGTSKDTQLRALQLLKSLLQGNGKNIFNFAYLTMRDRWQKLNDIVSSSSNRFTIQQIPPQFCNFFHITRPPSPAYAWFKCERKEEINCTSVLRAANIIGRNGSLYGANDSYVRLSLIKTQDDFNLLLQRLTDLVCEENIRSAHNAVAV